NVLTRNFEALKSIEENNINALEYLSFSMGAQREAAAQFDTQLNSDPLRPFFYALNEAIERTIQTILAREREQGMETQGLGTAKGVHNIIRTPPINGLNIVNAHKQSTTSKGRRTGVKTPVQRQQIPDKSIHLSAPTLDTLPRGVINTRIFKSEEREKSFDEGNEMIPMNPTLSNNTLQFNANHMASTSTTVVRRPTVYRSIRAPSVNEGQRRDSSRFKTNGKEVDELKSLHCPLCLERDMSLKSFITHLSNVHKTTPPKSKIAFKCVCGFLATTTPLDRFHKYSCRQCSLSVVKR
ncbi:hypothetical protein PMAYCL1PPCAC_07724, partial [Pristionchus mayeri]